MSVARWRWASGCLLISALALGGEVLEVRVYTRDGSMLTGRVNAASFELVTDLGKHQVRLAQVESMELNGDKVLVRTIQGSRLKGKTGPLSWKVSTDLGEFPLDEGKFVRLEIVREAEAPSVSKAPSTPVPPRPSAVPGGPGAGLPPLPEEKLLVAPLARSELNLALRRLTLSPAGDVLYALDLTTPRFLALDASRLSVKGEVPLKDMIPTDLSISPDGATAAVVAGKQVVLIDLKTLQKSRTFHVDYELADAFFLDSQILCATGRVYWKPNGGDFFLAISLPKQGVIASVRGPRGRIVPDLSRARAYTDGGIVRLPPPGKPLAFAWSEHVRGGCGDLRISPDGRFAVEKGGGVLRLGRSYVADLVACASVEPHNASIFLPKSQQVVLFTGSGFVKIHAVPSFAMELSKLFGLATYEAVADEVKGVCYIFGAGTGAMAQQRTPQETSQGPRGNLYAFRLSELLKGN